MAAGMPPRLEVVAHHDRVEPPPRSRRARRTSSRSRGPNCSADALYPSFSIVRSSCLSCSGCSGPAPGGPWPPPRRRRRVKLRRVARHCPARASCPSFGIVRLLVMLLVLRGDPGPAPGGPWPPPRRRRRWSFAGRHAPAGIVRSPAHKPCEHRRLRCPRHHPHALRRPVDRGTGQGHARRPR